MTSLAIPSINRAEPRLVRKPAHESASSKLGYVLFLLVNATLFVRPSELIESLEGWPIYELLIEGCLLLSLPQVINEFMPKRLMRWPASFCVIGLLPAVVLSRISHLEFGPAMHYTLDFCKLLIYYLLLIVHINSFTRLKRLLAAIAAFMFLMTGLALLQYHGIVNLPQLSAYYEKQSEVDEETGQQITLGRLCTLGIFNNPNDLSRILVICVFICLYFLGEKKQGSLRFLWAGPAVLFAYGNALTYSRGGFLGLLGGLAVLIYMRYGRAKTILIGAVLMPALLVIFAGRQTNVDVSDGTGHQRLLVWRDAFSEIAHAPVFGTGMGSFVELNGILAHNSFVQAMTELGFFGGTLFFGLFYFGGYELVRVWPQMAKFRRDEIVKMCPFIVAIVLSYGIGMLSSTRCYDVPTYTVGGIAAAYTRLLAYVPGAVSPMNKRAVGRVVAANLLFLAGLYVFVRIKA